MIEKVGVSDPRTYAIIGAAMEVHKQLGCGFLEPVYQEALVIEFSKRGIPFNREVRLSVFYKEMRLNTPYRVDFICFDEIAVELKALANLSGTEEAQLINYLKASDKEIGLLLNFGAPSLTYRRFILSNNKKSV
ncbi:MAG TPA: GxxExxY protein [Pyrinomonadaceae bacterium]|nr:GxxExxY protein [Pyrinomonadaceae bacterium]